MILAICFENSRLPEKMSLGLRCHVFNGYRSNKTRNWSWTDSFWLREIFDAFLKELFHSWTLWLNNFCAHWRQVVLSRPSGQIALQNIVRVLKTLCNRVRETCKWKQGNTKEQTRKLHPSASALGSCKNHGFVFSMNLKMLVAVCTWRHCWTPSRTPRNETKLNLPCRNHSFGSHSKFVPLMRPDQQSSTLMLRDSCLGFLSGCQRSCNCLHCHRLTTLINMDGCKETLKLCEWLNNF